jgi:adenosylhomocysteine nucleosidase
LINIAERASEVLSVQTKVYVKRILSGDYFVSSIEKKKELLDTFGGYCTEMEGAAVAHACYLNRIPFVIIRSISDKADDSAEVNFNEFAQLAAANSSAMLEKMMQYL